MEKYVLYVNSNESTAFHWNVENANERLTDDGEIVSEATCLSLAEVDSAPVSGRVMPLDVLDHENRRTRECRAEVCSRSKHPGIRGVLRFGHRLLSGIDPTTSKKESPEINNKPTPFV